MEQSYFWVILVTSAWFTQSKPGLGLIEIWLGNRFKCLVSKTKAAKEVPMYKITKLVLFGFKKI